MAQLTKAHQQPQNADTLGEYNPNYFEAVDHALAAANMGVQVFPCDPQTKRPYVKDWGNVATDNAETIESWWQQYPNAMIGAVTGHKSGFFVVDIDVKDGVDANTKLAALEEKYGALYYDFLVATPSGGLHLYFKMPDDIDIRNSAGKLAVGVDVRGNGGYVIYAGSTRHDGKQYAIVDMRGGNA